MKNNTASKMDSKRSSKKVFSATSEKLLIEKTTSNNYSEYCNIISKSKLIFPIKNQLHLFIVNCHIVSVVFSSITLS